MKILSWLFWFIFVVLAVCIGNLLYNIFCAWYIRRRPDVIKNFCSTEE